MAGKKDIVEQALKLIAGGAKEAGPSVAERAAKNIDVFNTANRLGVDTNDIAKLQETKRLMDYHKGFMGDVQERAKSLNKMVQQMKASGAFPMEIGTRYTTEHSRRTGQAPWTVTNYYVDPKNPQGSYGYYVRRELPEGGYEESISKIRDPNLEALHGPEKWEELQRGFVPMTGPKAVKASGGSIREGYQTKGRVVGDIVDQALKLVMGAGEKTAPSVLVERGKNTPISAWHATEKPFTSYDWGLLGSTTKPNVEGTGVENWAMDLARVGPWSSEKKIDLGFGTHIPVTVGGKGKAFNSLDDLQRAIAKAGGPDKFRQNMTVKGFGHLRVADEEFGGTSYVSLTPENFTVRDDPIDRASGGLIREGYGPGGWVDDVVKMAGKVISGEGEEAAKTGIRAYQGSPHNFAAERLVRFPEGRTEYIVGQPDVLPDVPQGAEVLQDFPLGRMRMDKIGTGEGAQAYGHGLYLAEQEGVAKDYRKNLAYKNLRDKFLEELPQDADFSEIEDLMSQGYFSPDQTRFLTELKNNDWLGFDYPSQAISAASRGRISNYDPSPELEEAANKLGHMYEVNIAADPNTFLDWDKPLSEQPEVLAKLKPLLDDPAINQEFVPKFTGKDIMSVDGPLANYIGQRRTPADYRSVLKSEGIPGVKFLDAGSRGAGDGTRNYVVFDDKLISIIRKYGIAGASAMLGYNLMDQLDPKQALAASMADQDYQASRPQRSMGGNNSISGALNVARGLNGGK